MIDLHSHILPALDDGPPTLAGSLEMARAALADGISVVAATPHVRDDHPTTADLMERRLAELREALDREGIPLDVRPGGELALERLATLDGGELARYGLGGSPGYVLLEFPYVGFPVSLAATVLDLRGRGITPVIAHPERNAEVQRDPGRVRPVVLAGALVQVTAASIDGRIGRRACKTGFSLVADGLAHVVASDAHIPAIRAIGMRAAVEAIGDGGLAAWLTEDVPAAILAGDVPPARPASRPRRRLFGV